MNNNIIKRVKSQTEAVNTTTNYNNDSMDGKKRTRKIRTWRDWFAYKKFQYQIITTTYAMNIREKLVVNTLLFLFLYTLFFVLWGSLKKSGLLDYFT